MATVVSVTGASDSGKTTFVERVLPALRARGLRVGTMKHASHGFSADVPGSDSARHAAAGASPVLLVGPTGQVLFSAGVEPVPAALARYFGEVDLVLVEGWGATPGPKVLVHRRAVPPKAPPPPDEVLFAITDEPLGHAVELAPTAIERAADLLADHVAGARTRPDGSPHVRLQVDGIEVPLGDFAARLLAGVVDGAVRGLHGVPDAPATIELRVKAP